MCVPNLASDTVCEELNITFIRHIKEGDVIWMIKNEIKSVCKYRSKRIIEMVGRQRPYGTAIPCLGLALCDNNVLDNHLILIMRTTP